MKVIGLNGSPHKDGNTYLGIRTVFSKLEEEGIETEILQVGAAPLRGCIGCSACFKQGHCVIGDETFFEWVEKIYAADGLLLAAPAYYGSMPGTMKSFLDRLFYQDRRKGGLRHKVAGALVVLRRSGGYSTQDDLNRYILAGEMLMVPTVSASLMHGAVAGEVLSDVEGIDVMEKLARNMVWLLKMKEATRDTVPPPPYEKRKFMSFIRPNEGAK